MVFDVSKISGVGKFDREVQKVDENHERTLYLKDGKAFLVENKNTVELRTDEELRKLLVEKYESVMESRYFGRGGIEIVLAGHQLEENELEDLVRLSYNLS